MGILERRGKVRTILVPGRRKKALQMEVHRMSKLAQRCILLRLSYQELAGDYAHKVIDHAVRYVDGRVHTNGLENLWSLLNRRISGTYVSVEPFHLFRYLLSQPLDSTIASQQTAARFNMALMGVVGSGHL